jgi:hypothetical protein
LGDITYVRAKKEIKLVRVGRQPHWGRRKVLAVYRGENCIGTISKYDEDRYTKTPWQAYRGYGEACKLAGSFYGPNGKQLALDAVTS